jgi:phosphate uptake regulator
VLKVLLEILVASDPTSEMIETVEAMFDQASELVTLAGQCLIEGDATPAALASIVEKDRELNRAERRIRKRIIVHLVTGEGGGRVVKALLVMNIVRDLERVGDYSKNLSQIFRDGGAPLPPAGDPEADELRALRHEVEAMARGAGPAFLASGPTEAARWIRTGKALCRRSDALITAVAGGSRSAAETTTLVLAARYYKRIAGHLMNVLTGAVMPLHKLDFYDESVIDALDREDALEALDELEGDQD